KELKAWKIEATQYRTPNPDIADVVNTVLKMGMKRAHVAATIVAVNVSDRFTQDVEDFVDVNYESVEPEKPIDTGGHPVGTQAAANHVRDQKLAEIRKEQDKTNTETTGGDQRSTAVGAPVIDVNPAGNGTPVKSTTPPPAGQAASTAPAGQSDTGSEFLGKDEEWQQICRQCAKPETRTQMFETFYRILQEHKPEEADSIYYGVLEQYGAKHAKEIKLLSHARQASRKLYDIVVPLLKGQA